MPLEFVTLPDGTKVGVDRMPDGVVVQGVKLYHGETDSETSVSAAAPFPVALSAASLAALEQIVVSGTVELGAASLAALEAVTTSGPLTETQLRAAPVPVLLVAGAATIGKVEQGATAWLVSGAADHDAPYGAQFPVPMGGYASSAPPIAVANGDMVRAWFGGAGQVMVGLVVNGPSGSPVTSQGDNGASAIAAGNWGLLHYSRIFDGTNWVRMLADSSGALKTVLSGEQPTVDVNLATGIDAAFDNILAVQGAAGASPWLVTLAGSVVPLPTGAATSAKQDILAAQFPAALVGGRFSVDVGASILPTGAATSAKQDTLAALLPSALVGGRLSVDVGSNVLPAAVSATATPADGLVLASLNAMRVQSVPMVYNSASMELQRTPNIVRIRPDASITSGSSVSIWGPTGGKKFRLRGGQLSLSVAGQIILYDSAAALIRSPYLPAGGVWRFGADELGNGLLSAVANNALRVDVTATGNVGGFVTGNEEV